MVLLSKQGCKVEGYLAASLGMGERCRAQLLPKRLALRLVPWQLAWLRLSLDPQEETTITQRSVAGLKG